MIRGEEIHAGEIVKSGDGLVKIEQTTIMQVFTDRALVDPILARITEEVNQFVSDVQTPKGRAEIASMAYKITRTKTYLDDLGKGLVSEMKELPKRVDANRKVIRDTLDNLRDAVRKPLDEWEEQKAKVEADAKAEEEVKAMLAIVEAAHEMAILMDGYQTLKKAENERLAAEAKRAREDEIASAIMVKAKEEATALASKAIETANQARIAELQAKEDAQAEAIAAQHKLFVLQQETEARIERATQIERERQEQEKRLQALETAKREANIENRRVKNNQAVEDLIFHLSDGMNPSDTAKTIVVAIAKGLIRNLTITY